MSDQNYAFPDCFNESRENFENDIKMILAPTLLLPAVAVAVLTMNIEFQSSYCKQRAAMCPICLLA